MQSDDPQDTEASPSANSVPQATGEKFFSKETAKYLYEDIPYIRALFGALDGGIISYSTFKIFFDIACPPHTSASDVMYKWLESPEIAALAALESLTIVALSFIGNVFDEDDDNKFIAWAAWFWAYFRDGFKAIKFSYRGVQTSFLLLGVESQAVFLSVGLGLGVLAAANRIWYRNQVTDLRKKYQKNNNTLLKNAQNLGLAKNYKLEKMPDSDLFQRNKIYIKINEKEGFLEYKVYDPFGKLVKGKINLINELLYRKQYNENGLPISLTFGDLEKDYDATILAIALQRGHVANSNDEEHRHLISAQMGACCSTVTTQWPDEEGANIELGPFDAGYVRVICEKTGRNGLFYAQKKWCCSLLMSEEPDQDVSKINLGNSESGYIRVINEKRKINQLYYVDKRKNSRHLLELDEVILADYDKNISSNNTPRALLTRELADITRITNHTHKNTTLLTSLEVDEENLGKYDSQVADYCGVKVFSSEPSDDEIKKIRSLNQIAIFKIAGVYNIGYCNEEGEYDKSPLDDQFLLQILNEYQPGEFIKAREHQARITQKLFFLLKSRRSRITQFNTLQALSLSQLATITVLTKHVHKEKQYLPSQVKRMASAILGGFSDSLYTYMGIYALAALSPPLFILAITCSILFTVLCVVNRCYEEYEYQQSFIRSRLNVEFVLLQKEMEATFAELTQISADSAWSDDARKNDRADVLLLNLKDNLLRKHREKKKELESITILSYSRAFLSGLKSGLYGYGAVCSLMFFVSTICKIACITFPPAVLVAGVILGLIGLIGFALDATYLKYQHTKKMEVQERESSVYDHNYDQLMELIKNYKLAMGAGIAHQSEQEREAIYRSMPLDSISQFQYSDLFEMIRSCGSGLTKGRVIDFPLTRFMDLNEKGHYQDTPWMVVLNLIVSVFYALVYALRSFAKNWRGANDVPPPVREEASELLRQKTPSQLFFGLKNNSTCNPTIQPVLAPDLVIQKQRVMMDLNPGVSYDANDTPGEPPVSSTLGEPKHFRSLMFRPVSSDHVPVNVPNEMAFSAR